VKQRKRLHFKTVNTTYTCVDHSNYTWRKVQVMKVSEDSNLILNVF
jgi:hypothetical protein